MGRRRTRKHVSPEGGWKKPVPSFNPICLTPNFEETLFANKEQLRGHVKGPWGTLVLRSADQVFFVAGKSKIEAAPHRPRFSVDLAAVEPRQ